MGTQGQHMGSRQSKLCRVMWGWDQKHIPMPLLTCIAKLAISNVSSSCMVIHLSIHISEDSGMNHRDTATCSFKSLPRMCRNTVIHSGTWPERLPCICSKVSAGLPLAARSAMGW